MAKEMTKGTPVHYVRPQEKGCRPGTLLADSFLEKVSSAGLSQFGHVSYGDPAKEGTKHTFECTRAHDPLGTVDTWHLAAQCPFSNP